LENRQERGFPQLPQALVLYFGNPKSVTHVPGKLCYLSSRLHRVAMRPTGKARRLTILGVFEGGAT
jgi:hypothetical protein